MRNFKYSWQQITKASFVGIATTATFYLAKTTGLFSSWLSTEEPLNALQESTELDAIQINGGQRRLLQLGGVVANPIPDQVIQVNQQYTYSLNNVFSGNYSLLDAVETGKNSLPSWLNLQYELLSIFPAGSSGSSAMAIAISGNTAFVADYGFGLRILDVSNPSAPRLLSTYGGTVQGVMINGSTAFVTGSSSLKIIDVSNTSNPRLLSTFAMSFSQGGVAISGSTVFAADYDGLQILDVSNTSNPRLLSTFAMVNNPQGVAISGSTAFVVDSSRLNILDVSNTSNPRLLSTFAMSFPSGVAISGSTAFVADYFDGLQILNVSNTTNPRLLSTYPVSINGNGLGVAISGSTAFVADGYADLQILDVSNLSNPRLLSSHPVGINGRAYGVAISGSIAFVADGSVGLQIIDVSRAVLVGVPPPTLVGQQISITVSARNMNQETAASARFSLTLDQFPQVVTSSLSDQSIYPNHSMKIVLNSDLLFVNPGNSFLKLSVAFSNGKAAPTWLNLNMQPTQLSIYPPGSGYGLGVAINGSTAFVANSINLQILDVSNPNNPRLLSAYPIAGNTVAISGSTAFVAGSSSLKILDVSNTSNPRLLSTFAMTHSPQRVAISGSRAFVTVLFDSLQILDVSNTSNPRLLSTFSMLDPQGVAISGSTAFVADSPFLKILDVSNTSNPRLLTTFTMSSPQEVAISGSTAFVSDSDDLKILDVSNTSHPRLLSLFPTSFFGPVIDVEIRGSTAFVVGNIDGLQILDVSNLSHPKLLGVFPGGGTSYGVAVSGNTGFLVDYSVGLQILDLTQWQLTATPNSSDVGNYQLQLIATDELGGSAFTQPFTIRVEGPPRFNATIFTQYAKVGQSFNYFIPQGLVNDPNNDPISFSARLANNQSLPAWLSFSSISAAFVGTPQSGNVGNITIVLSATDNIAGSSNTTFMLVTNHLPVVNQRLSNAFARVNQFFQLLIPNNTFSHPDGLLMNYSAQLSSQAALPNWLRFNASSLVLSGQPNSTDAGNYDVRIVASDIYAGQASTSFTLSVGNGVQVNRLISSQLAGVGLRYVFVIPSDSFVNPDGAPFSLQSSALPSWLTFAVTTAQFSGTPLASSRGITLINLTATDTTGGTAMQSFNLTVTYFPQVVNPIADQIAPISYPYQLNVSSSAFIDQNGYALTYRAEQSNSQSLPNWLSFNATSLQFSGLPNMTQALRYSLAVIASNPLGAEARDEFSLYAEHYPTVQQPIPDTVAGVDIPLRLTISGSSFLDLDNDVLRYNVTRADRSPLPTWLTFDPQLLVLSGTPLAAQLGNWSFLVTATDPSSGSAAQNFTLIVRYLPVVSQPIGDITPVREGRLLNYTLPAGTFTEAGGASLSYNATQTSGAALPSWLAFTSQTQNFIGVPSVTDVGSLSIRVIADDGQGGQASVSFSFTITPNYPPVLAKPISNSVASVNQPFRLALPPDTFSDANNDPLSYTASQVDGSALPRWLAFDEKTITFSGTPGRSDTGDFSERIIPVRVTARDDQNSARTQFNINVQGTSNIALFVQIATPIATIFTALFAAYKKRALCFNRYKKERYERLDVEVKVGEVFEHKFGDMNLFGKKILVKTPRQLQGWGKLFTSPRERVPGGGDMPSWMEYDIDSNSLRSTIPVPEDSPRELIIQVKDDASIVHEQFTLRITGLQTALNAQPQPDVELATAATF